MGSLHGARPRTTHEYGAPSERIVLLSPSADLFACERTGRFRLGTDQLLRDAKGESRISAEDFALAMMAEVEHPQHIRRRFTVGY